MYILLIALFLVSLEYVISSNRSGCTTCIATATTVSKEWCRESTGCVDDDDEERHCRETCAANEFEIVTNIMIVFFINKKPNKNRKSKIKNFLSLFKNKQQKDCEEESATDTSNGDGTGCGTYDVELTNSQKTAIWAAWWFICVVRFSKQILFL